MPHNLLQRVDVHAGPERPQREGAAKRVRVAVLDLRARAEREFGIDWEQQTATCPQGKLSSSWTPAVDKFKNRVIKIKFSKADCQACPVSVQCTHSGLCACCRPPFAPQNNRAIQRRRFT